MEAKQQKILLIEDDEMLSNLYTDLLLGRGYLVDTAADGQKALEKISKGGWNLILSDIVLPTMDGVSVIEKAKKDNLIPPSTPVVFLTNMYTDDQSKRALSLGDGYLVKVQLTPDVFLANVEKFLLLKKK